LVGVRVREVEARLECLDLVLGEVEQLLGHRSPWGSGAGAPTGPFVVSPRTTGWVAEGVHGTQASQRTPQVLPLDHTQLAHQDLRSVTLKLLWHSHLLGTLTVDRS